MVGEREKFVNKVVILVAMPGRLLDHLFVSGPYSSANELVSYKRVSQSTKDFVFRVLGNQVTSKYTYLWPFELCVIEREVEETLDDLGIVCLASKLNNFGKTFGYVNWPLFSCLWIHRVSGLGE
jgi:hypothetical protein